MEGRVRWIAFGVIALAALGGLAFIAQQRMPGVQSAMERKAEEIAASKVIDCTPNPHFERYRGLSSDWQHLRKQRDGSTVEFNPFTIACNPETGERDVWAQILRARPEQETFEDAATIETISFTRDRYQFRIDCVGRRYTMLERRIMGDSPEGSVRTMPMAGAALELQPIEDGGVAAALLGPTCARGR